MERLTEQESWVSHLDPEFNDAGTRVRAATSLATSKFNALLIRRGLPALRRASTDADPAVRAAAAATLRKIEQTWADSPTLREAVLKNFGLGRPSWLYRDGVKHFDKRDVTLLLDGLADAEVSVRRTAAYQLKVNHRSGVGDHTEWIIESLVQALDDGDAVVREEAANALFNISDALQEVHDLDDRRPERVLVHWAKVCAYGWGVELFRRVAVPALEKASSDPNERVRAAALDALQRVPGPRPDRQQLVPTIARRLQEETLSSPRYDPPDAATRNEFGHCPDLQSRGAARDHGPGSCGAAQARPTGDSSAASPVGIHLYVDDVDEVRRRVIAAGIQTISSLFDDRAFGERSCSFVDPFDVLWIVITCKEKGTRADMQRRLDRMGRVLREPPPLRFDDV